MNTQYEPDLGWNWGTRRAKPLGFDPRFLDSGSPGPIGACVGVAIEAAKAIQAQPTVTPQFGEMWRRNSDGMVLVCISRELDSDRELCLCTHTDSGGISDYDYASPAELLTRYTRVDAKPALNWQPIAQWDERDRVPGRRYIAWNGSNVCLINGGHKGDALARAAWTRFAVVNLPEAPQ